MASNLLKALKKIDDGRMNMIKNIRESLGKEISDNASFASIAQYVGTYAQDFSNIIVGEPRVPAWERPKEWYDCYSILRNAEEIDGYKPCYIVMLNTDADTTTFPAPNSDYYGNTTKEPVKYGNLVRRLVLSDGTFYDNVTTDIVHTWDKSKDLVITEGDFAGTYRWFMTYEKAAQPKYLTFAGMPVAELLINYVNDSGFYNCNWIVGYTTNTAAATLINFEVLAEFNKTSIGVGSLGMYQKTFYNCKKLRHFALGPVTSFSPSSSSGSQMSGWDDIVSIDCPKCPYAFSSILSKADSLQYLNTAGTSISVGMFSYLKEINTPSAALTVSTTEGIPGYIREDCKLNIKGFNYNPPIYWTSNRGYKTYVSGGTVLSKNHYNLRVYDATTLNLQSALVTTSSTTAYSFMNCPNLREFLIPNNWQNRLDLSDCKLNHGNVLEIIDNLADLNTVTGEIHNPFIKLSDYNKSQLTEAEIEVATNKGWVIE